MRVLGLVTVAERLLANETVKIAGHELSVKRERPAQTTAADDTDMNDCSSEAYCSPAAQSSETDDLLARCVFIEDVPEEMCDFLEVVIENANSGGGPVELFEPDPVRGGVLVRFVDQQGT